MKYTPKPHQSKAIESVFSHANGLDNNTRTQMLMSCGTGKTYTSLRIAEKNIESLDSSITIMLFPSLYLIDQTKKEWEEQTNISSFKSPLIICSDETIGLNESSDIFEIDECEVEYTVTTNFDNILKYIESNKNINQLIFSTYHSSHLLGKALKHLGFHANLTLFDEAHKTAISNSSNKKSLGFALNDSIFPSTKRLFMTATAKHYIINKALDTQVAYSMDNEELYGKVSYEYSLREAINDNEITDYKILGILIDNQYIDKFKIVNTKAINSTTKKEHRTLKSEIKAAKLKAIEETMKKFNIKSGLSFHTTIEESKYFAKQQKNSNVTISHLDGTTNHKIRYQTIKDLEEKSSYIVSNSKLLTEGVNMPEIGMVFLDKTMKSIIDITQIVGRVQRVSKNNPDKIGYIMLPLFVGDIKNIDVELERNGELKNLFDIINSFRQSDYQLRDKVALKKFNKKNKKEENVKNILPLEIVTLDDNVDYDVSLFQNKIETIVLNSRPSFSKQEYINATIDFIEKYSYKELQAKTVHAGLNIGEFRNTQKKNYKKLRTKREQNEMQSEFSVIHKSYLYSQEDVSILIHVEATLEYIKQYGYQSIRSTTSYNDYKIGVFRSNQRKKYKKLSTSQEKNKMKDMFNVIHKDYLLNGIDTSRRSNIDATIDYISKYGYASLLATTTYNGFNIGIFRASQRTKYKTLKTNKEKEALVKEFSVIHKDYLSIEQRKNTK